MASDSAQALAATSEARNTRDAQGVSPGLRQAALFTSTVAAFYGIALIAGIFVSIYLTGNVFSPDLSTGAGPTYAGQHSPAVAIGYIADVADGAIFTVPFVTAFAVLRRRWPVYAHLILLGGIMALVLVTVKNLISYDLASSLGPLYLSADAAHRATLLPLGTMAAAIRQGLQDADTYPILATLVLMATLPKAAGMSWWTKVLGFLITIAFLLPFGPIGFFIAALITPAWAIPLGGWLKRTTSQTSV